MKAIEPVVDDTNWRVRVEGMNNLKFDDNAKLEFLKALDKTGKIGLACQAAGITCKTWREHKLKDPKFFEAVEHTIEVFNQRRAATLEKQAMEGFDEVIFGPTGEKAYRKRYETQLRVLLLKASDRELYADKSQVDINISGGAFIIPATLKSDDWEKQFHEQQANFVFDTVGISRDQPSSAEEIEAYKVPRPRENE